MKAFGIARRVVGLQTDLAEALGRKVEMSARGAIRNPCFPVSIERGRETIHVAPA